MPIYSHFYKLLRLLEDVINTNSVQNVLEAYIKKQVESFLPVKKKIGF